MQTRAVALSLSALFVLGGCAGPRAAAQREVGVSSAALRGAPRATTPETSSLEQELRAGDYVVYRFSGSFRKASPLTLTERVLGRDGRVLDLEVVLEDGARKQTLHLRKDSTPGAARELFDVTSVEDGRERPATVEVYEAMMAKTVLAADANEEQLGTETASVLVGGQRLRCLKTSYRVRVGKQQATMSTVTSETFPWGDVAGDITTLDGQVLYRVEVIAAGTGAHAREVGALAAAR